MTINDLLSRLSGVKQRGTRWSATCPAHEDRSPSLSISEGDRGLLLRCFAGCSIQELCSALGIVSRDLFYDAGVPRSQRPAPRPARIDKVALAFRYELAALDLRMRAENVLIASRSVDTTPLPDGHISRLMNVVANAYQDVERAQMFEHVADGLREKDYHERQERHATYR